jgi:hypothetical protein
VREGEVDLRRDSVGGMIALVRILFLPTIILNCGKTALSECSGLFVVRLRRFENEVNQVGVEGKDEDAKNCRSDAFRMLG